MGIEDIMPHVLKFCLRDEASLTEVFQLQQLRLHVFFGQKLQNFKVYRQLRLDRLELRLAFDRASLLDLHIVLQSAAACLRVFLHRACHPAEVEPCRSADVAARQLT